MPSGLPTLRMIHLIYPHRNLISAPDVIGYMLGQHLSRTHEVRYHNFDSFGQIYPEPGDVLLGHAHPFPSTIFRRSVRSEGWARRILVQPFNGEWEQCGFIDDVIDDCDHFLAITGSYWFNRVGDTRASRWKPKMVHLDLAVDRKSFPPLKSSYAEPGKRRFVYIGNDHPGKNLPYLDAVAARWSGGTIDWAGRGRRYPHLNQLGYLDFSSTEARTLLSQYDFLITLGSADANPTTILEAMSWGLIPICTPTSGYQDEPGVVNVPPSNVDAVCATLDSLQHTDSGSLELLRQAGEERVERHYNWGRFLGQVDEILHASTCPRIQPRSLQTAQSSRTLKSLRFLPRLIVKNALYRQGADTGLRHPIIQKLRNWVGR